MHLFNIHVKSTFHTFISTFHACICLIYMSSHLSTHTESIYTHFKSSCHACIFLRDMTRHLQRARAGKKNPPRRVRPCSCPSGNKLSQTSKTISTNVTIYWSKTLWKVSRESVYHPANLQLFTRQSVCHEPGDLAYLQEDMDEETHAMHLCMCT